MEFLCLYELCFSMLSIKAFNTCAYPSLSQFFLKFIQRSLSVGVISQYTASLPSDESS